jgi:hypothetical protein
VDEYNGLGIVYAESHQRGSAKEALPKRLCSKEALLKRLCSKEALLKSVYRH